jgi:hypothetical protein
LLEKEMIKDSDGGISSNQKFPRSSPLEKKKASRVILRATRQRKEMHTDKCRTQETRNHLFPVLQ